MKLLAWIAAGVLLVSQGALAGEAVSFETYRERNAKDPALKKKAKVHHSVFAPTGPSTIPDTMKPVQGLGSGDSSQGSGGAGGSNAGAGGGAGGDSVSGSGGEPAGLQDAGSAAIQSNESMNRQTSEEVQAIIKQNGGSESTSSQGIGFGQGSSSSAQTVSPSSSNHPVLTEQQQALINRGTRKAEEAEERARRREAELKRQREEAARQALIRAQQEEAARRNGPGFNRSR